MNLKAGTIYFIGEKDLVSDQLTPYTKLGLIREGEARTSMARLSEHQTGNPRELVLRAEINTPAVSELESVMHAIFAPYRVNGEWFILDQVQFQNALDVCNDLASELKIALPTLKSAEAYSGEISDGNLIEPTPESLKWYAVHCIHQVVEKRCEGVLTQIKSVIRLEASNGDISSDIAEVGSRKTTFKLDKQSFKVAHPEIYAHYETTTTSISGVFKVMANESNEIIGTGYPELDQLIVEVEALLQSERISENLDQLHKKHLQLIGIHSKAQLLKEIAKAHLRSLCGKADGIATVCTWKRTAKTKTSLNEKGLIERHPDLVAPFMKETKVVTTLVVKRRSKPKE